MKDEYRKFITQANEDDLYDFLRYLVGYRNLLMEGVIYASVDDDNLTGCQYRTISVCVNGILYGHTFVFFKDKSSYFMMPLAFVDHFYPSLSGKYEKLNSMIQPTLLSFAKLGGFSDIVGKQGDILEKYYGYKKQSTVFGTRVILLRDTILDRFENKFMYYTSKIFNQYI